MDNGEINILELLQSNENISQRELSEKTGLSLGMVNLLLKRFLKVGIIKTEKMTGNKIKYMLTPNGFVYLADKTINYVSRSYQAVIKIRAHIKSVIDRNYDKGEKVYIYAEPDEIYKIVLDVLKETGNPWELVETPPYDKIYITWGRTITDAYGVDVLLFTNYKP